ncbi:MAG: UDP-N-acetylmuramoyl-L-alanyl-D-glutamate--2,6-diaminopimelate ligase, partial [Verrucomicrobia bacterium]|nr:UDP-N-acetylmuramoyl-L-alanyl-D-glutamate--2,6-diaminopimelate ligase [Verrucomicrobiota bacterium]
MYKVLESLLAVLPHEEIRGRSGGVINSVTQNSKTVTPGALFIALSGSHHDGNDYIMSALERGAVAIVVDREESIVEHSLHKIPFIIVEDARAAMASIAAWFYDYPARKLEMIGITGTNGKTSVAFMTCHLLRSMGKKVGMIGTVRYEIGSRQIPAQRTTPDAIELQRLLHEMVRVGCSECVMEVSSHAIDQKRVAGIPFRIMVFTNLTRDHLDYHQDLETYFKTKRMLMDGTVGAASTALRIINVDDAYGRRLQQALHGRRVRTFGQEAAYRPDILARDMDLASGYTRFLLHGVANTPATCLVPLIGRHNVSNILAAAAIAYEMGIEPEGFKNALSTMPAVPGRLEPVHCGQPFSLFIDYAHTEDALYHVLTTMKPLAKNRLHCVFGC